jgi:sec-independent protein translocase protein TatA
MLSISLGAPEILIIFLIILLLFGAPRLPALFRSLGMASKEFKRGTSEDVDDEVEETTKPADKRPRRRSGAGS